MSLSDTDLSICDADASARRMSAERNALRSIPTEALERDGVFRLITTARDVVTVKPGVDSRDAAIARLARVLEELGAKP